MDMVNTCKSFGCVGENFKGNLHACEVRNALPQLYIKYLHVFPIGTDAEPNCPVSASDIAGINLFTTKLNCIDTRPVYACIESLLMTLWNLNSSTVHKEPPFIRGPSTAHKGSSLMAGGGAVYV